MERVWSGFGEGLERVWEVLLPRGARACSRGSIEFGAGFWEAFRGLESVDVIACVCDAKEGRPFGDSGFGEC